MKHSKIITAISAAVAVSVLATAAFAETITLADTGYGINGGKTFYPDGITANTSTLGDLAASYDSIDFTISVADLGGRDDLSFQVYVAAGSDWSVWANGLDGGDTPQIAEAGVEYKFSLNVDEIAEANDSTLPIVEIGFQILSATEGDVDVTYGVSFVENGTAAEPETQPEAPIEANPDAPAEPEADKTTPDTGVEGVAACAGISIIAIGVILVAKAKK